MNETILNTKQENNNNKTKTIQMKQNSENQ